MELGFAPLSLFWPFLETRALGKNKISGAHQIKRIQHFSSCSFLGGCCFIKINLT